MEDHEKREAARCGIRREEIDLLDAMDRTNDRMVREWLGPLHWKMWAVVLAFIAVVAFLSIYATPIVSR